MRYEFFFSFNFYFSFLFLSLLMGGARLGAMVGVPATKSWVQVMGLFAYSILTIGHTFLNSVVTGALWFILLCCPFFNYCFLLKFIKLKYKS